MAAKPYYITTPIYYPSGNPHIGHCYTTVACDSIARYRRMQGYDVMFLTGTDEHGLKIEQKAAEKGVTPKEYVDEIVKTFKSLWSYMNISYDRYIRTTDDYHVETVQKIFKELYDKGYIYKGKYQGKYCTPCESFWTESQLVDGKCPERRCAEAGHEVHRDERGEPAEGHPNCGFCCQYGAQAEYDDYRRGRGDEGTGRYAQNDELHLRAGLLFLSPAPGERCRAPAEHHCAGGLPRYSAFLRRIADACCAQSTVEHNAGN